jgi:protease IV
MRRYSFLWVIAVLLLTTACAAPKLRLLPDATDPLREFTLEGSAKEKILLIPVRGMISDNPKQGIISSSPSLVDQVVAHLRKAEKDKQIKAVLIKISSPGGTITASDLLYHEIAAFKERTGTKIVVSMMEMATSGAYYMSLPADTIMAHPTSVTGSVGVIFLRPKVNGLMDKIGVGVDVSKYGKYKDMGSPFRAGSEDEQKLFQKTVNDLGDRFVSLVRKHRKMTEAALADMSTARIFLPEEALKMGLIDRIGYLSDAVQESKRLAGLPQDARVVVFRRNEYPEDNFYNVGGVAADNLKPAMINIELPDILGLHAGFYYLWPGAVAADQ